MSDAGLHPKLVRTPDAERREVFHSYARAMCPTCRRLIDAARVIRGGKVYLAKRCPACGPSEALISGDAEWFLASLPYVKPGSVPLAFSTETERGCPLDCGLCPDHEQHTCLPIVEITNHCNLSCPVCLVSNRGDYHMSLAEMRGIVEGLIAKEGTLDNINLSGGEPTVHPRFLDLLDLAIRPEIARVSVSTNGVRIANDPALCEELARRKVYVNLQQDALDPASLQALRGAADHERTRRRALENLERAGVRTTIVATVARGVNEDRIGDLVRMLIERRSILSLMIQPVAYTGQGGRTFGPHDPRDILTIPDVVRAAEEQTGGLLRRSDFLPLPCSHPSCFALTYLLETEGGYVPFPRFIPLDRYLEVLENRGTMHPDERLEDAIRASLDDLWTGGAAVPESERILRALKRTLLLIYPEDRPVGLDERLARGESLVKTLFIHAFMDEHTFDVERVRRCCTHYALPDGRLMPACSYNMLYRNRAPAGAT